MNDSTTASEIWQKYKTLIIAGIAALVAVLVIFSVVQYRIGVANQGEAMQENVEATYKLSQNSLSNCIDKGNVAAQVTEREYESIGKILKDVASARYTDAAGNSTDASGVLGGGRLFSALQEQYPQIDQRSWQNLQVVVTGCRDAFQGSQDRTILMANNLDTWMKANSIWNSGIKAKFPTESLDVIDLATGETVTGDAALAYMTRVISVKAANEAFESGELGEQNLFGEG